eukprot:g4869.t1
MPKGKKKKEPEPEPDLVEDEGAEGREPPPPGCKPMMISGKNMEKYELKTGGGLKDTVPFKKFDKAWVMAEIQDIGFYSEFFNFKADLDAYDGAEVLIVADPEEQYGENWLIVLTQEAWDAQMAVAQARVDAEEAIKRAEEEKAAAAKAAEDAILNAVYEDKPILPRPWNTETAVETAEEVANLCERPSRPLLRMNLVRKHKHFRKPHTAFQDRLDTQECRQHRDPNYELKHKVLDVGLQGAPPTSDTSSQTRFFRHVNSTTQCEPITAAEDERAAQLAAPALQRFLERVVDDVEGALQRNETFDVFQPECSAIASEEMTLATPGDNTMQELKTFTDLEFSKNKALPAIDWHPTRPGEVVVAATNNATLRDQIESSGKAVTSKLLIWHFTDLIHPQLMLESPYDTHAFRFNRTHPSLVAAGCTSGQVVLWDTTEAYEALRRRKAKVGAAGGSMEEEDERDKRLPPVKYAALSHIDSSHRRPITDLHWLPAGMEVSPKGTIEKTDDKRSHQFVTIAGDGQACIWDVRYREIAKANPRLQKELKPNKDGTMPEVQWQPHFKVALTKLEGVGELGLCRLYLKCLQQGEGEGDFSSQFFCSTEEGEMVFADWNPPKAEEEASKSSSDNKQTEEIAGPEYVQWMSHPHFRPSVALQRSPFFADIFVDVTDWSFTLWKDGVLFVAKADGTIDVWDFTDQSHRASTVLTVAPVPIVSIEFSPPSSKRQLLAAGDKTGNLHILDTPMDLLRPLPNERQMVRSFIERELNHVNSVAERMRVRDAEREAEEKASEMREQAKGGDEESTDNQAKQAREEAARKEEEYRGLESDLRQQLGLEADIGEEDEDD